MKTFKTNLLGLALAGLILGACGQVDTFDSTTMNNPLAKVPVAFKSEGFNARVGTGFTACGEPHTAKLLAGQNIPVGEVTVFNDNEKFYVTVSIEKSAGFDEGDWFIRKIHGYFGAVETDFLADPKGKQKKGIINPSPGKFPISEAITLDYSVASQEYTYELPISQALIDAGEFDVAIHAEVVRVENIREEAGVLVADIVQEEGAWGEGTRFNPVGVANWSMYMSYTIQDCDIDCDPLWNKTVKVSTNNLYEANPEDELEVTYQVNDVNQGRIGEVTISRGGSKNANDGFTFTMTFIPDEGFDFTAMSTCISATNADGDTGSCESNFVNNGDGTYSIVISNAPYTSTGSNPQAAESYVKISVTSNACE
jgi:hypothetical protein